MFGRLLSSSLSLHRFSAVAQMRSRLDRRIRSPSSGNRRATMKSRAKSVSCTGPARADIERSSGALD